MVAHLVLGLVLNPLVSVETKVVPLEAALAQAAPKGVRLVVDGPIGRDLVALRAKEVPLETFKAKVSEATVGVWAPIEGGFRLSRDSVRWSNMEKAERTKRLQTVSEAIIKVAGPVQKAPAFTADAARKLGEELREASNKLSSNPANATIDWAALQGRSPGDRLLARALLAIDPAEIATMVDGERKVWSSRPNRLQRPFTSALGRALELFIEESGVWQANKPAGLEVDALGSFGIAAHWATASQKPTRVLLIVSAWSSLGFVSAEIKLLDDKANEITGTSTSFNLGALPGKEEIEGLLTDDERKFELSKPSLIIRALKSRSATEMPADIRKRLLNPQQGDPYLHVGAEIAQALAGDKPFVAVFTDSMLPAFETIPAQTNVSSILSLLKRSDSVQVSDSDGWVVMTPVFAVQSRNVTLDRERFGAMLLEMEKRGGPSLAHLRELSKSDACLSPALFPWLRTLYPDTTSGQGLGNWDLIRLYDALLPSLSAQPEQTLAVGRAPETVRKHLGRMVYYSVFSQVAGGLLSQSEEVPAETITTPTSEPTEVWPDGIPGDVLLNIVRANGRVLAGIGSEQEAMEPAEFGAQLAMRERPDVFPWITEMPLPAKFAVLDRDQVLIRLGVKEGEWLAQYSLADLRRTDGLTYVNGGFAPDLQRLIDTARAEARKLYGTIASPGRGGNIPPLNNP